LKNKHIITEITQASSPSSTTLARSNYFFPWGY